MKYLAAFILLLFIGCSSGPTIIETREKVTVPIEQIVDTSTIVPVELPAPNYKKILEQFTDSSYLKVKSETEHGTVDIQIKKKKNTTTGEDELQAVTNVQPKPKEVELPKPVIIPPSPGFLEEFKGYLIAGGIILLLVWGLISIIKKRI